jgi:hypothetical protein
MKQAKTNSDNLSGEDVALGTTAPQSGVLLQVFLWAGAADVPSPALAMVADLLQVRGGELRESTAGSIAATFSDAAVAVNAARNLQRLVQGFASAWQGGVLGGCTTLSFGSDAGDGVSAAELRGNSLLEQVHPGQVVLLGSLCDAARAIPGLEFRALAGVALSHGRKALQLLPPRRMEGYIDEPFVPRAVSVEPVVSAAETVQPQPMTPRPPAYVLVSPPSGKSAAVAATAPISGSMRAVPPVVANEIGAFSRKEKTSGVGLSRWVLLGGAAAAVVGCVLLFMHGSKKASPVVTPAQQSEPTQTVTEPAGNPVQAISDSRAVVTPVVSAKAKDSARRKDASHPATAPAQAEAATTPAPAEETHAGRGITFSPAEISLIIAHADKDSGNGNFDKAIEEYRSVLSREPANELAKRGLQRALYNKEHQ